MYTITILTKRKPGVSRREFFAHYESVHFELASALPDLVAYEQAAIQHGDRGAWREPESHADYDALSTYTFPSWELARKSFDSEFGKLVDQDTGAFIDWPSVVFIPSTSLQRYSAALHGNHVSQDSAAGGAVGDRSRAHLRLIWPQWQGAGTESVAAMAGELPLAVAHRAYATGARVLETILPAHIGPTAVVPVEMSDEGLEERDGIEAKGVVIRQLQGALRLIAETDPDRITTLGGECSVSVAPFASLAARYGDDLAVLWIDSHPDISTNTSDYAGYHSMAVSALTGHGDADVISELPGIIPAERVALVGLHEWFPDDHHNIADWGLSSFAPDELRADSSKVREWLANTGATRVAIHFDVDAVDSNEEVLGLGAVPDGLTSEQIRRLIKDVAEDFDIVGFTVAEYLPRQVAKMGRILEGLPLVWE